MTIVGGEERAIQIPSPVTRLTKGYGCQEKHGTHMVDLIDRISGHVIAHCIYEPYADEMLAAFAAEASGIGVLDRTTIAVAIERADVQKIPDGYADGVTGQPAIKHEEVSDWSAWLADAVIAASISSREAE